MPTSTWAWHTIAGLMCNMLGMADDLRSEFRRYADLISPMIRGAGAFTAEVETAGAVQVERGVLYAAAAEDTLAPDVSPTHRLIELSDSHRLEQIIIVDRAGHS